MPEDPFGPALVCGMALAPFIVCTFRPEPILIWMQVLITSILFWRHRSNIRNLLSGAEDKLSDSGKRLDLHISWLATMSEQKHLHGGFA